MQFIATDCDFCGRTTGRVIIPDGIDANTIKTILINIPITIQCEECANRAKEK